MGTAKTPFAIGKRSLVYLEGNHVVKKEHPNSKAINRISNEINWLKIVNQHNIGPKFLGAASGEIRMELVNGICIVDWLKSSRKSSIMAVLVKVLKQCRTLDKLHVNKYELTNPYKHIIIRNKNPVMIDFERCRYAEKPKNATQFCQFIMSKKIIDILHGKGIEVPLSELQAALKNYKKNQDGNNFNSILRLLGY